MKYQPTDSDYRWAASLARRLAYTHNVQDLQDDAAQEARIAVWQASYRYQDIGATFRTFASKHVIGRFKDMLRRTFGRQGQKLQLRNYTPLATGDELIEKRDHYNSPFAIAVDPTAPTVERMIYREDLERIRSICTPKELTAVERLIQGWTQQAIADADNVTPSAVSCRIKRLREFIRQHLPDVHMEAS